MSFEEERAKRHVAGAAAVLRRCLSDVGSYIIQSKNVSVVYLTSATDPRHSHVGKIISEDHSSTRKA